MRYVFTLIFVGLIMSNSHAQSIREMLLYKEAIPNSKGLPNRETVTVRDNVMRIAKVNVPSLTAYFPDKPNGKSVIICPGGGYQILAFDKEGTRVAEVFNQWGYTAFVLKYRLPDDSTQFDKSIVPLMDAQQAIKTVRKNAAAWGLLPNKIGIMGFSAGGHLASTASTHYLMNLGNSLQDTISARPDFSILLYPVISFDTSITHMGSRNSLIGKNPTQEISDFYSNEKQVNAQTPPAFLVHAGDDKAVPVENSIRYYQACIKNGVRAEMHLYPAGGHGFGLNNKTTTDDWMQRLRNWLEPF